MPSSYQEDGYGRERSITDGYVCRRCGLQLDSTSPSGLQSHEDFHLAEELQRQEDEQQQQQQAAEAEEDSSRPGRGRFAFAGGRGRLQSSSGASTIKTDAKRKRTARASRPGDERGQSKLSFG